MTGEVGEWVTLAVEPLGGKVRGGKRGRNEAYAARALEEIDALGIALQKLREE